MLSPAPWRAPPRSPASQQRGTLLLGLGNRRGAKTRAAPFTRNEHSARRSAECSCHAEAAADAAAFRRERSLVQFVRLSSERTRQALRQDCSFAKKQEPPPCARGRRPRRQWKTAARRRLL